MTGATELDGELDWNVVSDFLRAEPERLRTDDALLDALGLKVNHPNIVDFTQVALSRLEQAKQREAETREAIEAVARANYAAQAQTHAAVLDLLGARNHADLARRVDDAARLRFGLESGVLAVEGPGATPAGWHALEDGVVDAVLGAEGMARMGQVEDPTGVFGDPGVRVKSAALVRITVWEPARHGVLAFGSPDAQGFTTTMGAELVAFLSRVVERMAERWPVM